MNAVEDDDSIKVYCTVCGLTEDRICQFLRSDVLGSVQEVKEQFAIKFMPDQRPLQILEYQRGHYKMPNYDEQSYFLIVDSVNVVTDGVLLCNLEAEHGFPDAVRNLPDMAGMTAASLSIANSNWTEVREGTWYDKQPPIQRLAVYDNRKGGDRESFFPLADAVDVGLQYVDLLYDDGNPQSEGSIDDLFRYIAISLDQSCDTDELIKQHRHYAAENNLDANHFAVVDDNFTSKGALLIQVEPRKEVRCRPPVAGELLYWHAIGFMDWHEVEEFASKHSDYGTRVGELRTAAQRNLETKDSSAGNEPDKTQSQQAHDTGEQEPQKHYFKYYRTTSGMLIASLDAHEIPTMFTRPRQKSDGVDDNGDMSAIKDTIVEELPWDYYQKTKDAEEQV